MMKKQNKYICRKANIEEVIQKWNYEISLHPENLLYRIAKKEFVEEITKGTRISYIGILNGNIICDITAIIKKEGIKNETVETTEVVTDKRAFLCGIRTNKEQENQGYFSKLFHYLEEDLKKKGFTELSLAVDREEKRNIEIYKHLGFNNYITSETKEGNGRKYTFDYYYKK